MTTRERFILLVACTAKRRGSRASRLDALCEELATKHGGAYFAYWTGTSMRAERRLLNAIVRECSRLDYEVPA